MGTVIKFIIITFSCVALFSCGGKDVEQNIETQEHTISDEPKLEFNKQQLEESKSERSVKTLKEILDTCFKELILKNGSPSIIVNQDGYYQLDFKSYFSKLEKLEIFDSAFYEFEKQRMTPCFEELEISKVKPSDEFDGIWEPNSCFSEYAYWVNAQEYPQFYDFTTNDNGDTIDVRVSFYDEYETKRYDWENVSLNIKVLKCIDGNHRIYSMETTK